jgi:hypothetical protein
MLPLVKTISPPKITIMINGGMSQNFLRTRMKSHSSSRNDITALILPGFRCPDYRIISAGAQLGGRKHRRGD